MIKLPKQALCMVYLQQHFICTEVVQPANSVYNWQEDWVLPDAIPVSLPIFFFAKTGLA
jgi:hypothetical protein